MNVKWITCKVTWIVITSFLECHAKLHEYWIVMWIYSIILRPCHKEGYAPPPPPPPSFQKWQSLHKRWGMYWIEWKIIFQIFPIFSFWVIGRLSTNPFGHKKKLFKSGQICREDWNWPDNYFLHGWFFFYEILSYWDIVYSITLDKCEH